MTEMARAGQGRPAGAMRRLVLPKEWAGDKEAGACDHIWSALQ